MAWIKMYNEDLQKLRATVPNLVTIGTWRPGFVHVCSKYTFKLNCMTELENSCVLLCPALSRLVGWLRRNFDSKSSRWTFWHSRWRHDSSLPSTHHNIRDLKATPPYVKQISEGSACQLNVIPASFMSWKRRRDVIKKNTGTGTAS